MGESTEPDIIFKWTSSCRLCLSPDVGLDIFTSEKSSTIVSSLQSIVNVLIYQGDPMPRKICDPCLKKLTELSQFREDCLKTEQELKRRLQPYCKIDHVQEYFDRCAKHNKPNSGTVTVSSTSKCSPDTDLSSKVEVDSLDGQNSNDISRENSSFKGTINIQEDLGIIPHFQSQPSAFHEVIKNRLPNDKYSCPLLRPPPSLTIIPQVLCYEEEKISMAANPSCPTASSSLAYSECNLSLDLSNSDIKTHSVLQTNSQHPYMWKSVNTDPDILKPVIDSDGKVCSLNPFNQVSSVSSSLIQQGQRSPLDDISIDVLSHQLKSGEVNSPSVEKQVSKTCGQMNHNSVGTIISVTGCASDLWSSTYEESNGNSGKTDFMVDLGDKDENSSHLQDLNEDSYQSMLLTSKDAASLSSEQDRELSCGDAQEDFTYSNFRNDFTSSRIEEMPECENQRVPVTAIKQENGMVLCSKCSISLNDLFEFEHHECKLNENKIACIHCGSSADKFHKCHLNNEEQSESNGKENALKSSSLDENNQSQDLLPNFSSEQRFLRSRAPKNLENITSNVFELSVENMQTNIDKSSGNDSNLIVKENFSRTDSRNDNESHTFGGKVTFLKLTPWKCVPCEIYLTSRWSLREHYKSKQCLRHFSTTYKCELCFQYYTTYQELLQHQVVHIQVQLQLTDDDLLPCEICGKQFANEARLKQHSIVHYMKHMSTISTCYPCLECGEVYFRSDLFEFHQKSHNKAWKSASDNSDRTKCAQTKRKRNIAFKSTTPHKRINTSTVMIPERTKTEPSGTETSRKYKCDYCDHVLENFMLLLKHVSFVHRIKNVKCEICNQAFLDKHSLEEHKKTHSGSQTSFHVNSEENSKLPLNNIRCRMCGKFFSSTVNLKQHESRKHKNRTPFSCRKCPSRFSTRTLLLIHHRVHLSSNDSENASMNEAEDWEVSDLQNKTLSVNSSVLEGSEENLALSDSEENIPSTLQQPRYKCPLCPKTSFSAYHVTAHITFKHPGKTAFPLPITESKSREKLKLKTKSSAFNGYKCSQCCQVFVTNTSLNDHLLIAHKTKSSDARKFSESEKKEETTAKLLSSETFEIPNVYKESPVVVKTCPFCLQQLTVNLTQHIKKYHRGERADPKVLEKLGVKIEADRTLVCRYCFKVCSSSHNRRVHESIHSHAKVQWLKCEKCDKKFFSKSLYDHHKKVAHVSESFHCQKCNKIFFKESFLYQHICPKDEVTDRKTFKCPQCPKSYDALKGLKTHITVAHKTRPIDTNAVVTVAKNIQKGKSVRNRDMARELWREESNKIVCKVDDKYYCTLCDVEFSLLEECRNHERVHPRGNWYMVQLNDTFFQCTVCNKIFDSRKGGLLHINYHKKTSIDDIPIVPCKSTLGMKRNFRCPFCNITYSTEANLENHIFYVHPDTSTSSPSKKVRSPVIQIHD